VTMIHLCLIGSENAALDWSLGKVWLVEDSPKAIFDLLSKHLQKEDSDAWLFWDSRFAIPEPETIGDALSTPGDVWHAGLKLGLSGLPRLMDFVSPTWMLNRDPDPDQIATSWRISLRACLIRTSILQRFGGNSPDYRCLDGASLELGHRYMMNGAIVQHFPALLANTQLASKPIVLPFEDESRFIRHRFGKKWTYWALIRAFLTGYAPISNLLAAFRQSRGVPTFQSRPVPPRQNTPPPQKARVSILIPTLNRYEYLRRLLPQLKTQTIPPAEIIIVDQTPEPTRVKSLSEEFDDLPLRIFYLKEAGQCSARNAGLNQARGDYILFLDDDDEVPSNLIEAHLGCLQQFQVPVSCGDADVAGAAPLAKQFYSIRCSDVFPTNNTLIHRSALESSGLFDLAYDHGERADGDLGMRVYLSGKTMILNSGIRVLHHHAKVGGLRTHRARVITYGSSRSHLLQRQIPSVTQIYLWKRYFTPHQVKERLLLSVIGTLSYHGPIPGKVFKLLFGSLLLPYSLWQTRANAKRAQEMLSNFPKIPVLSSPASSELQ
jgi:glycosyltransferase involved in cell wall biosynthesis